MGQFLEMTNEYFVIKFSLGYHFISKYGVIQFIMWHHSHVITGVHDPAGVQIEWRFSTVHDAHVECSHVQKCHGVMQT